MKISTFVCNAFVLQLDSITALTGRSFRFKKKSFYMSMEKNKAQTLMVQYSMFIVLYYTAQTDKPKH